MASITVRNLDPVTKERLRKRAAAHGHSMGAEARRILQTALTGPAHPGGSNLFERVHSRFAALGCGDLEPPKRDVGRKPPDFD
jgi:plasmid stability protein